MELTSDGGFIVTGITSTLGSGGSDAWLLRTDANGDTLWTRTFGGSNYDEGHSVQPTSDGGYIITGKYYDSAEANRFASCFRNKEMKLRR